MNFTLKEIDILHVAANTMDWRLQLIRPLQAMSELLPEFEQIIQKVVSSIPERISVTLSLPFDCCITNGSVSQSSEEEIDDEDDDEEKDEEKSQDELHRSVDFASGSRDTLDLDAIVVPNETKTVHVDPEAVQEMTSFSKRMFPTKGGIVKHGIEQSRGNEFPSNFWPSAELIRSISLTGFKAVRRGSVVLSIARWADSLSKGSDEGEDDKQIQEEGMQDQRLVSLCFLSCTA
eukprot:767885-Hanusia_phi.AAC.6